MKMLLLVILVSCLYAALCEDCTMKSDLPQCQPGQICAFNSVGICLGVIECEKFGKCALLSLDCVADYCQLKTCDYTGQCVHGQVCSQDKPRTCVYPKTTHAQEGSKVQLTITEPGDVSDYRLLTWYHGPRETQNRVVSITGANNGSQAIYHGEYCAGGELCYNSTKGSINTENGELTINHVTLSDNGFYYYNLDIPGVKDTGPKYEYRLSVHVTPEVTIEGVPDSPLAVGTELFLKCTCLRSQPDTTQLYWEINGRRIEGTHYIETEPEKAVVILYTYKVSAEDAGSTIKCVAVPQHGGRVEARETVYLGGQGFTRHVITSGNTEVSTSPSVVIEPTEGVTTDNPPEEPRVGESTAEQGNHTAAVSLGVVVGALIAIIVIGVVLFKRYNLSLRFRKDLNTDDNTGYVSGPVRPRDVDIYETIVETSDGDTEDRTAGGGTKDRTVDGDTSVHEPETEDDEYALLDLATGGTPEKRDYVEVISPCYEVETVNTDGHNSG